MERRYAMPNQTVWMEVGKSGWHAFEVGDYEAWCGIRHRLPAKPAFVGCEEARFYEQPSDFDCVECHAKVREWAGLPPMPDRPPQGTRVVLEAYHDGLPDTPFIEEFDACNLPPKEDTGFLQWAATEEHAEFFGRGILAYFNRTRRDPRERARVFVRASLTPPK